MFTTQTHTQHDRSYQAQHTLISISTMRLLLLLQKGLQEKQVCV